ncbi:MAG: hypothetical protein MUC49_07110 [Raineya sp.]|jgi:hypothetical protein|nr:hypothetical protein [Raineya sp.]
MKNILLKPFGTLACITLLILGACNKKTEKKEEVKETPKVEEKKVETPKNTFMPKGKSIFKSVVKGGGDPFYEVFYDLDKDKKELEVSIIQNFDTKDTGYNGQSCDADICTISVANIDFAHFESRNIKEDKTTFKDTAYDLSIFPKNTDKGFAIKAMARGMSEAEATIDTVPSARIIFKTKQAAEDFIKEIKSLNK